MEKPSNEITIMMQRTHEFPDISRASFITILPIEHSEEYVITLLSAARQFFDSKGLEFPANGTEVLNTTNNQTLTRAAQAIASTSTKSTN